MPCNCSGVCTRTCCCKLVPRGFLGPHDLVLVQGIERHGFGYRLLEGMYNKCAAYNLRYCPLRGTVRRDKCLSTAVRDLMVLVCFLVANFVVFLNIVTKMTIHIYYVLKNTVFWIRSRPILKQLEENDQFHFEPHLLAHDYSPPSAKNKLNF